jgi:hypothetical protein
MTTPHIRQLTNGSLAVINKVNDVHVGECVSLRVFHAHGSTEGRCPVKPAAMLGLAMIAGKVPAGDWDDTWGGIMWDPALGLIYGPAGYGKTLRMSGKDRAAVADAVYHAATGRSIEDSFPAESGVDAILNDLGIV